MGFFSVVSPWKLMLKNCVGSWLTRCSGEYSVMLAPLHSAPKTSVSAGGKRVVQKSCLYMLCMLVPSCRRAPRKPCVSSSGWSAGR